MTQRCKWIIVLLFISLMAVGTEPGQLRAGTPTEQVKGTAERVVQILKDSKLRGEAKKKERRELLRRVILPRFDFAEMAKRALGSHWSRNPGKQREFVSAFTQLLEDTYADQIAAANCEKIVYIRERLEQNFAEVDTKAVSPTGEEVAIDYKLHLLGKEWKVYDVVVENISLVNNYRSQFQRVLSNASLDELIRKMNEKKLEKSG